MWELGKSLEQFSRKTTNRKNDKRTRQTDEETVGENMEYTNVFIFYMWLYVVWISFETSVTLFSETAISDGESLFGLEKKKFPAKKIFHFPPNSQ